MKFLVVLLIAGLSYSHSFGQRTESFIVLNSGLFAFRGVSAEKISQINTVKGTTGYTNNPFGAGKGLSYGLSYQIQHISRSNFIIGIGVGYENLRSKTTINAVNIFDGQATLQEPAAGRSNLANHFINVFPFAGYRIIDRPIWLDLIAGADLSYLLKSSETGQAVVDNGSTYISALDRTNIKFDLRPRVQLSAGYARVGIYAGYAIGMTNYRSGWVGGQNQCSSELVGFGLMYRL